LRIEVLAKDGEIKNCCRVMQGENGMHLKKQGLGLQRILFFGCVHIECLQGLEKSFCSLLPSKVKSWISFTPEVYRFL
jgi:hypothetical protein